MTALRLAAAVLAALLLPACDRTPDELLVDNRGFYDVVVDVEYTTAASADDWTGGEHRRKVFEVAPGRFAVAGFHSIDRMDVLITRKIDGLVVFRESYRGSDFDDDHRRIEIAVYP